MEVRLEKVRIAFPALDKPEAMGDGKPAYQLKGIIEPNSANSRKLEEAILAAAKDKWKDKALGVLDLLREDKKLCLIKAPYKSKKTGEPYLGFEGKWSLSARKEQAPTIFNKHGVQVTNPAEIKAMLYSGAYAHIKVDIWAQDNSYGRRINAALQGVMFAADGEAFGGSSPASADDFADLASDETDSLGGEAEGGDNSDLG